MLNIKRLTLLIVSLILVVALVACGGDEPEANEAEEPAPATSTPLPEVPEEPEAAMYDCHGAAAGDEVSVLYQWSGAEEESFAAILAPLLDACGITLAPESSRDQALVDTRVQAGTPWDMVIWPTTGPAVQYGDTMDGLDAAGADASNYDSYWADLGTIGGSWLAVPVKADIKSIIWYSPVTFEAFGYEVPATFEDLDALVEQMVADGNVPWSMGFGSGDATGWTGSDFIQDILLVTSGPDYVLGIIDGSIPYDDAGVAEAYEIYANWASDAMYTVGGVDGTLNTGFLDAIYKPFADPPEAMMVKQSGFAGGAVTEQFPELSYGADFDFFGFPGAQGLQGGADWMMVFNATPAVQAVVDYLTSEAGGAAWAAQGFALSPNKGAAGNYADIQLAKSAEILATASGFTPDIGDSIPGGFGSAEWAAIIEVVSGGDIADALAEAAAVQAEALGQ